MWLGLLLFGLLSYYVNYRKVLWVCSLFCQIVWISLVQWAATSVVQQEEGRIVLRYVWKNSLYKIRINTKSSLPSILTILDDRDEIVTERVLPYMGPGFDWHGQAVDPGMFGCKELILINEEGEEEHIN